MRPLARWAVRLYPAAWRERYGKELQAVVEDAKPGWASVFDLLKGAMRMRVRGLAFVKLAAVLAVAGAVAGLAISFLFTPRYVSTGVVLMRVTGSQENGGRPEQRLNEFVMQTLSQTTARQSLSNLIQGLNLYSKERQSLPLEDVEDIMRGNMRTRVAPVNPRRYGTAVISVEFSYPDRGKAQEVARAWLSQIVEGAPAKWDMTEGVSAGDRALLERIARLQARIDSLEKHFGLISPEPAILALSSSSGVGEPGARCWIRLLFR